MKVYRIHADSQGNYVAVKQGWSWSAFGLTCLWAVSKKIWKVSTVSMGIFLVLAVLAFVASAITSEAAMQLSHDLLFIYVGYLVLGFSILMGLNGNQWYEKNLSTQGYTYQKMLVAENAKQAVELYVKQSNENTLFVA
ncbi:MAG TPA: DUF2628 domain-containing protein [Thiothrix sp.]|nr:DUF2628 domain-containing protein [Thiothrix sp.]